MVNFDDSIKFRNVISRKYSFYYKNMYDVMEKFTNDIVKINATIKGPFFYSINNIPMDEMLNAEFFMPVEEDSVELMEDMYFHSYYSIEDMISVCLYSNFESNMEVAYRILLDYIEENKLRPVTPMFHVLSGDESLQYIFIKIGVTYDGELTKE